MKNKILMLMIVGQLALVAGVEAQNVAINTTGNAADPSAILDISSTTKGLLIPRLDPSAITSPVNGMMLYNTTTNTLNINTGTSTTPTFFGFVKATAASALAPITYSSSAFTIAKATASIDGYLAGTDFTIFSAKQTALTGNGYSKFSGTTTPTYNLTIPNADLANSTITIQGTSTALGGSINIFNGTGFLKAAGTTISYDATTLSGATGSANYLPKFNATGPTSLINTIVYDDGSSHIGVNTATPSSTLQINGSLSTAVYTVNTTTTYGSIVWATSSLIIVSTVPTTFNLPTASGITGRIYTIKNGSTATGFIINTISGGSEKIDGATTYTGLSGTAVAYKFVTLQSDGTNWFVIANN